MSSPALVVGDSTTRPWAWIGSWTVMVGGPEYVTGASALPLDSR